MRGISRLTGEILAAGEGRCSLQLINQLAGKCKVVPVPKYHVVKSKRVRADIRHAFPTTTLVRSEQSAPRSNRLTQRKRP